MNILIIEDVEPYAFLLAALVKGASNRVEIAHTMADGWKWLNGKNGFDVVVLDLWLPDSSVSETLGEIQKIKKTGRKVVIVSGRLTAEAEKTALDLGADGCISKGNPEIKAELARFTR